MTYQKMQPRAFAGRISLPTETLRITLIANAGLLLQYGGVTLMLDGIYGREGHPFSNLSEKTWEKMLNGAPPFEKIEYLLFSHAHPDHFSFEMTEEFLRRRSVKGVFFPDGSSAEAEHLKAVLRKSRTPGVPLSRATDSAIFRIEPQVTVQAFCTPHLDPKFRDIPNFCYLITFGTSRVLLTADVDYTQETFDFLYTKHLQAVFVNPLFFNDLRHGRFFHGNLNTERICVYHVPFSGEDRLRIRPMLARDLIEWPADKPEAVVLCGAFQHVDL